MSATDRSRARLHHFLNRTQAAKEGRLEDTQPPRPRRPFKEPLPRIDPIIESDEIYFGRLQNFVLYMTVAFCAGVITMLCGKLFMFHIAGKVGLNSAELQANGSLLLGCALLISYALVWKYRSLIEFGTSLVGFFFVLMLEPAFAVSFPNAWAGFFSELYVAQIIAANPNTTPWMWDAVLVWKDVWSAPSGYSPVLDLSPVGS